MNQDHLIYSYWMKQLSFFICLCFFLSCNAQDSIKEKNDSDGFLKEIDVHINYYDKKIVIFWSPTEKEQDDFFNSINKEDLDAAEDDISYYNTMTMSFIFDEEEKRNFKSQMDTNDYCGFIVNQRDTIILNKKDYEDLTLWKIILFDGIKPPLVVSRIVIEDDYYNYFNIKKE